MDRRGGQDRRRVLLHTAGTHRKNAPIDRPTIDVVWVWGVNTAPFLADASASQPLEPAALDLPLDIGPEGWPIQLGASVLHMPMRSCRPTASGRFHRRLACCWLVGNCLGRARQAGRPTGQRRPARRAQSIRATPRPWCPYSKWAKKMSGRSSPYVDRRQGQPTLNPRVPSRVPGRGENRAGGTLGSARPPVGRWARQSQWRR